MKLYITIIIALSLSMVGCKFLDTVPENDIETVETIFEQRSQVQTWMDGCLYVLSEEVANLVFNPDRTATDEIVAGDFCHQIIYSSRSIWGNFDAGYTYPRYLNDGWQGFPIANGLQMSQEPYGNLWKSDRFYSIIRYCNIAIDKMDGVYNMEESEKKLWAAEVKAMKAHLYFELMRRYGPIVLVPQNIESNADIDLMLQPRSPVDSCVKAIVELLDDAMTNLPPLKQKDMRRWTYHSLESAASLKALALLYAASPLFNGNPAYSGFVNKDGEKLFPDTYDPEKWKLAAEAADEAIRICLQNGKTLKSGNMSHPSKLLNVMADIEASTLAMNFENDEAIYMLKEEQTQMTLWSIWTLPFVSSTDYSFYHEWSKGCIAPSLKMVEMYYTDNGLPIGSDKEWDHSSRYRMGREVSPDYRDVVTLNSNTVLGLHLRREPRFYAHIAADRCYWQRGTMIDDDMVVECYRGERYGTSAQMISSSVAQNLTGYYMKKGTYSNVANNKYSSVYNREEAYIFMRLADLYLMKAEAWNEYEGPLADRSHVYEPLNAVRERAGIPDVETSWVFYSLSPDKVTTKEGMREIIHREWDVEFAFEGRRFWNLRRWLTAADEMNGKQYGWNILGEDAQQFYNNYEGPVVVWDRHKFISPRDYLFPLRSEEVLISGNRQNPGW